MYSSCLKNFCPIKTRKCMHFLTFFVFFFSVNLPAKSDIVVESVNYSSLFSKIKIKKGDRLQYWKLSPYNLLNKEISGDFKSIFHWYELMYEYGSRGQIKVIGKRDLQEIKFEIYSNTWEDIKVSPMMPKEVLITYKKGMDLVSCGKVDAGAKVLKNLLDTNSTKIKEDLLCWIAIRSSDIYIAEGKWEKALVFLEQAKLYAKNAIDKAVVWEKAAIAREANNELVKANHCFGKAALFWKNFRGESLAFARAKSRQANILKNQGRFAEAKKTLERAMRIQMEQAPGSLELSYTLNTLGAVAIEGGELNKALNYLQSAYTIREELAPDSLAFASILNNFGSALYRLGDLESASSFHIKSLNLREKLAPNSNDYADSLNNLGIIADDKGDLDTATDLHRLALSIRKKLSPNSLRVSASLNNLGLVAWDQGDIIAATLFHERALSIEEKLNPGGLISSYSLNNLGNLSLFQKKYEPAANYYRKAISIREKYAPNSILLATTYDNLGIVLRYKGDLSLASDYHARSMEILEKFDSKGLIFSNTLFNIGNLLQKKGDSKLAIYYHKRGLAIRKRLSPGSHLTAESHHRLALSYYEQNNKDAAFHHFEKSIHDLENQLSKIGGSFRIRTYFHSHKTSYYQDYIECLMSEGFDIEAFAVLERARARTLLQMLDGRNWVSSMPSSTQSLSKKYKEIIIKYDKMQLDRFKNNAKTSELMKKMNTLSREQDCVLGKMEGAFDNSNSFLGLDGVQRKLEKGTTLLSYSVHYDVVYLFVVRKSKKINVLALDITKEQLVKRVKAFISTLKNPGKITNELFKYMSANIYNDLVAPAEPYINKSQRIIIIPDGPLFSLPFGALIPKNKKNSKNKFLVQDYAISIASSATVFYEQEQRPKGLRKRLLAFGDPIYPSADNKETWHDWDPGLSLVSLPATAEEVMAITELYGNNQAKALLGQLATEERAKNINDDVGILHFACHSFLDVRRPLDSALILTIKPKFVDGDENGFLQAWEIIEFIKLNTDLVVLSACGTGLGHDAGIEGLIGLKRAFQIAGARSLIASLWTINDKATALFMKKFYYYYKTGLRLDEALRKTQIEFIDKNVVVGDKNFPEGTNISYPFYWAAFQLYGPS